MGVVKLSFDTKGIFCYNEGHMENITQNIVPTTRKQNLAAAKACDDHYTACSLFRALQYANDMGTTEVDFNELAEHFIQKDFA